jgi:hypothetical protein
MWLAAWLPLQLWSVVHDACAHPISLLHSLAAGRCRYGACTPGMLRFNRCFERSSSTGNVPTAGLWTKHYSQGLLDNQFMKSIPDVIIQLHV